MERTQGTRYEKSKWSSFKMGYEPKQKLSIEKSLIIKKHLRKWLTSLLSQHGDENQNFFEIPSYSSQTG